MFLLVLLLVGLVYSVIGAYTAQQYYQETNQRLNAGVAKQILKSTKPFNDKGKVNDTALKQLFEKVMFLNPSIEVYLLDKEGKILSYFAPDRKVKVNQVDLKPIKRFIQGDNQTLIQGTDPKSPKRKRVFSAASIKQDNRLQGYLYVILASKDYQSITNMILDSYILKGSGIAFLVTLVFALLIGMGLIWLITRYTRQIIAYVNHFKAGDYQVRIPVQSNDDLGQLATAFNEMAATIQKDMAKIQEMEQARSDLVANVSHDLRTPLANLTGYVETLSLKGRHLSIEQKDRYLNIILQNATRLKKLVDELFELSKLEARQIEPQKEPFFINELVQDIASKYQLREDLGPVRIEATRNDHLPPVYADVSMIDRVIQNLLDNAIKFSPEDGRITIELRHCQQEAMVRVADNGPGIPESERALIFHRYRKPSNGRQQAKGSGLGLAIVKNMLEIQGFAIHVESQEGAGSVFYFYLPFYHQVEEAWQSANE